MSDIRKGVYILPNLFTSASLLCGFYALVKAIEIAAVGGPNYQKCALPILLAALFDGMDGRVARSTRTATKFGVEYDSLSDLVSFGVVPAVVTYLWALRDLGRIGWLVAFLFIACGALRLARFNVQAGGVERKSFQGLPIPMAAMMLVGALLIWEGQPVVNANLFIQGDVSYYVLILTITLAALMVSTIPYRSFKTLNLTKLSPFYLLVALVVALGLWATTPFDLLFLMGSVYVLSGPVESFIFSPTVRVVQGAQRRRRAKRGLEVPGTAVVPPDGSESQASENVHPLRKL